MALGIKIPVVKTGEVFHIGNLEQAQKAERFSTSFEGHCLSVSHCPTAWRSIAKLGGSPLWALRSDGGVFLDVWKAARSKKLRSLIETWGLQNSYVERLPRWKAWNTDEEGEWRYMLCPSEAEAQAQVEDDFFEEGPNGGPAVEEVLVLIGTDRLGQRVGRLRMDDMDAFDFLAMVWAEDTQPDLDGVWWREAFAPECLSAPRGGIFPARVARWRPAKTSFSEVDDDEAEARLACGFVPDATEVQKPKGASIRM